MSDTFDDFIHHYRQDGLRGRYWRAPAFDSALNKYLIIFIYGHHASIERNRGLLQYLRNFGQVLIFDIPGFGGMDSFYKIGHKPSLDNYAAFVNKFLSRKLTKDEDFTLMGLSFGFLVISKLLQRYPKWQTRNRLCVSLAGLVRGSAFKFSPRRRFIYLTLAYSISSFPWTAGIFRYLILNRFVLKRFYSKTALAKSKFVNFNKLQRKQLMEMEIHLWHCNDVRTWAFTSIILLKADLSQDPIQKDLYHIGVQNDQFLDNDQNLRYLDKIYAKVHCFMVDLHSHAPTVIADEKEAATLIPAGMIEVLQGVKS